MIMKNTNTVKAEFHVHTNFSNDSLLNKYLILLMCKIKQIGLLAITDHNEIEGAVRIGKFLNKYGIEVIVGEEIMTSSGEIIGLYLTDKIEPGLPVEETIKKIKDQNGIVYLPHPFDEKRYKTVLNSKMQEKYKEYFDFIEIHNGRNINLKFSNRQKELQQKMKINKIIGSDAHTFIELGRNYIEMELPTRENIIECVQKGVFHEKKCIKVSHFLTKIDRIIKLIEKGDFNGVCRIIIKRCKRKK